MQYNIETFTADLITPRLVEWFNALPSQDRTVAVGELFIVKVKVLANATGEPVFVIGADPTTTDPTREYVGEAVFLWTAGSGTNLTATSSSFTELSKTTANPVIRTTGFVGSSIVSNTITVEIFRMTAGVEYHNDGSPFAIALTGTGMPDWRPTNLMWGTDTNLVGLTDVSASNAGWAVGRKSDGTVWIWGDNLAIGATSTPTQVTLRGPARRVVALEKCFIALLTDGTLQLVGSDEDLPLGVVSTELEWTGIVSGIPYELPTATNIIDLKGYHHNGSGRAVDASNEISNYIVYQTADGVIHPWGITRYSSDGIEWYWTVSEMASALQTRAAVATHFTVADGRCGYCDPEEDNADIVGDPMLSYGGEFDAPPVKFALAVGGSVVALTENKAAWVNLRTEDNSYLGWVEITGHGPAVDVEAGTDHVIVLWEAGYITEHTGLDQSMLIPTTRYPSGAVRQLHAGPEWTAALLYNDQVQWWNLEFAIPV